MLRRACSSCLASSATCRLLSLLFIAHIVTVVSALKYSSSFIQSVNNETLFGHPFELIRNFIPKPRPSGFHIARAFVVESWWAESRKLAARTICKYFSECVIMPGIFGKELSVGVLDMLVENNILRAEGWLYSKVQGRAKLGTIGNSLTHMLLLDLWNRGKLPGGDVAANGAIAIIEDDLKIDRMDFEGILNANLATLPATWQVFQMYNKDCTCHVPGYLKPVRGDKEIFKIGTRWRVGNCVIFSRRFALTAGIVYSRDGARLISNSFPIDDLIDSHFASLLRGVGGLQAFTSCHAQFSTRVDESDSVRQLVDSG